MLRPSPFYLTSPLWNATYPLAAAKWIGKHLIIRMCSHLTKRERHALEKRKLVYTSHILLGTSLRTVNAVIPIRIPST